MHEELTPTKIIARVPAARELVDAIPIDVLRVMYDPDFVRELIKRVSDE